MMASIDNLHQESHTLTESQGPNLNSAISRQEDQTEMNQTERLNDHVCHCITTQESRPRPIKETLYSRHHSNCSSKTRPKQESLQNLHTHAVESAPGNNRVLKERPPKIADEEQRLNRKQLCTGCSADQATSVQTVELRHRT